MVSNIMENPSQHQISKNSHYSPSGSEQQNARASRPNRGGATTITVRTAYTAAASTLGATWTTTTCTAATTTTYPLTPQCQHVAHRLAASNINNRNNHHDRDSSNLPNHKAPTTAGTSAQDELTVDSFQRQKRKIRTWRGLLIHADRSLWPRVVYSPQATSFSQQTQASSTSQEDSVELDHGRPREPKKLRLWLKRHLSFFVEATCKDEETVPRQLTNKKLEEHRRSRDH